METTELFLKIAGLVIRFAIPESDIPLDSICRGFLTNKKAADIYIEGIIQKKLPGVNEEPVYCDKKNIVFGIRQISRYIGRFSCGENVNSARCCIQYDANKPGFYRLTIKKKVELSAEALLKSIGLEYLLALNNRVVLHSSYIIYEGKGIVFTAPSGTGKSTQADLWKQNRKHVEIVNGDRSVLSCEEQIPMVHGIPFCGSSGISLNRTVPLCAIVVLRQGKENKICRLRGAEAVKMIYSECCVSPWDKKCMENILQLLITITEETPVYLLSCLPDVSAVELLDKTLKGDEK